MRSDDEVEHYSDLWFEVVVLDSLVEHIDASDIDESFSWREFSARAAAMLPPSDAPPTEAELFARLDLTIADVRRANSAALESLGSADAHGDDAAGGSSHGTSASGASTREAACAARPRTRIEDHVQEALRSIERAVGAPSDDECSLYGAQMNADTLIALKAMGIEPTARNYALAFKADQLIRFEATEKGTISDYLVYWYMACMYAEDQKPDGAHDLASFATPSARDVQKVRALILKGYGTGAE